MSKHIKCEGTEGQGRMAKLSKDTVDTWKLWAVVRHGDLWVLLGLDVVLSRFVAALQNFPSRVTSSL